MVGFRVRPRVWWTAAVVLAVLAVLAGACTARPATSDRTPGAPAGPTTIEPVAPPDPDGSSLGGEALVSTPDGRSLLSSDGLGRLAVLDLPSATLSTVPAGVQRALQGDEIGLRHAVAASPDGRTAYLTDEYGPALRVVDLTARSVVATVAVPSPPTTVVATPDGRHLQVGDTTGTVTTVDTTTRAVTGSVRVAPGSITALATVRDGRSTVALTAGPDTLTIADTGGTRVGASRTVALPHPVSAPAGVGALALDPDGRRAYVVAGGESGTQRSGGGVMVVDLAAGNVMATVPADSTTAAAVSPDGRRLYLARTPEGPTPRAPDVATAVPAPVTTLVVETRDVTAGLREVSAVQRPTSVHATSPIALSPDGRHLYLAVNGTVAVVGLG